MHPCHRTSGNRMLYYHILVTDSSECEQDKKKIRKISIIEGSSCKKIQSKFCTAYCTVQHVFGSWSDIFYIFFQNHATVFFWILLCLVCRRVGKRYIFASLTVRSWTVLCDMSFAHSIFAFMKFAYSKFAYLKLPAG